MTQYMFHRRISGLLAYSLISRHASTGRSFKLANHGHLIFFAPHATAREGGKGPGSIQLEGRPFSFHIVGDIVSRGFVAGA